MPAFKIAAAQVSSVRGDVDGNIATHAAAMAAAAKYEVAVLVFPELSLTGYEPDLAAELAITAADGRLAPLLALARDKDLILTDKLGEKELIDRLGTPLTTFRPRLANMIAGIILAILMVGGGSVGAVAIMLANHKPQDVTGAVIVGIFLVGLALGGIALLFWVRSVISLRVLVCPEGFIQIARGKAAGGCWDQISEVKVMEFSRGEDTNRKCTVRRQDGRTFVFTTNGVHGIAKLITIFSGHVSSIREL